MFYRGKNKNLRGPAGVILQLTVVIGDGKHDGKDLVPVSSRPTHACSDLICLPRRTVATDMTQSSGGESSRSVPCIQKKSTLPYPAERSVGRLLLTYAHAFRQHPDVDPDGAGDERESGDAEDDGEIALLERRRGQAAGGWPLRLGRVVGRRRRRCHGCGLSRPELLLAASGV